MPTKFGFNRGVNKGQGSGTHTALLNGTSANRAPGEGPGVKTPFLLHHFFEHAVDAHPNAPALRCADERLSYADLDAQANRLAHYLVRRGVRPGDRVGLLFERSVHTYVALLAVLKCGAAFVPLDASFPAERLAYIAGDADLRMTLTTTQFGDALDAIGCTVVALDAVAAVVAAEPGTRLQLPALHDSLTYIIYTSGTTGRPKGVAINQSHICNFLQACTAVYALTASDRVYQGMTLAFDFSIEEIWPTFIAGATLVAGPTDHRRLGAGPDRLFDRAGNHRTLLRADASRHRRARRADAAHLARRRRSLSGGPREALESLRPPHAEHLRPNRDDRHRHLDRTVARKARDHRPADADIHRLHPRRQPGAAAGWRSGRDLHRWAKRGRRLRQPPRANRREIHPRSVQYTARRTAVPHRRLRPLHAQRRDRIPGPSGYAGKDSRLPHRTERDRGGAAGECGRRQRPRRPGVR